MRTIKMLFFGIALNHQMDNVFYLLKWKLVGTQQTMLDNNIHYLSFCRACCSRLLAYGASHVVWLRWSCQLHRHRGSGCHTEKGTSNWVFDALRQKSRGRGSACNDAGVSFGMERQKKKKRNRRGREFPLGMCKTTNFQNGLVESVTVYKLTCRLPVYINQSLKNSTECKTI